jgi:hypothetical protein
MYQHDMLKISLLCITFVLPSISLGASPPAAQPIEPKNTPIVQAVPIVKDVSIIKDAPTSPSVNTSQSIRPMTEEEFVSSMCVLGATAGLALTYMVGPNEIIMLVVGGVVVPSSSSVLFVSLFGTMAAAGCTLGATSTPAISWLYQHYAGK